MKFAVQKFATCAILAQLVTACSTLDPIESTGEALELCYQSAHDVIQNEDRKKGISTRSEIVFTHAMGDPQEGKVWMESVAKYKSDWVHIQFLCKVRSGKVFRRLIHPSSEQEITENLGDVILESGKWNTVFGHNKPF